jgi:hypothetical protein
MNNTRPPRSAAKALLVGGGAPDAERLAAAVRPDAQIICFAADRAIGDTVGETIRSRRPHARIAVMIGDPSLLVHKVSGPFDVIVDAHEGAPARRELLRSLLAGGGELYG